MTQPLCWPLGTDIISHIKSFEAEGGVPRLKAYKCPAGKWTIGWGTTVIAMVTSHIAPSN